MQILTAKAHQEMMTKRWHEDCAKWHRNGGLQSYPQLAMYGFHRNYGYVTFENGISCWRKTKKESIEAFLKWMAARNSRK